MYSPSGFEKADGIESLLNQIRDCIACPGMFGPPVVGLPVRSEVMLVGQAPGSKEIEVARPFAWTAGKTLFRWFASIGLEEQEFRRRVYMAAVCRCFPGKHPKGGDRVPDAEEVDRCSLWRRHEMRLLRPKLVVPVGKLAIQQFLSLTRLDEVVGRSFSCEFDGVDFDLIPLPHPSGASVWHRVEPGKTLLQQALNEIGRHPAWQRQSAGPQRSG